MHLSKFNLILVLSMHLVYTYYLLSLFDQFVICLAAQLGFSHFIIVLLATTCRKWSEKSKFERKLSYVRIISLRFCYSTSFLPTWLRRSERARTTVAPTLSAPSTSAWWLSRSGISRISPEVYHGEIFRTTINKSYKTWSEKPLLKAVHVIAHVPRNSKKNFDLFPIL